MNNEFQDRMQYNATVYRETILKKITNFALQLKGKKFQKRTKMDLPIIGIERIPLLQVYFSLFIAKQGTIFKDICFKQDSQFCSVSSSSGLAYYGLTNWSFRRQIVCANYFIIIIYNEVFLYFFPNQFLQKIVVVFFLRSGVRKLGDIQ